MLLLEEEKAAFPVTEGVDYLLVTMGERARKMAVKIAGRLRKNGRSAVCDMMDRSFKNQMKYANKIGAAKVIILGEDEVEKGICSIKDMKTGEQVTISADHVDNL